MPEYKPGPQPSSFKDDGTKARLGVEVPRWMVSRLSNLLMKGFRRPLYMSITHSLIGILESPRKDEMIVRILRQEVSADNFVCDPLEWMDYYIREFLKFKGQGIEGSNLEQFRAWLSERKGWRKYEE